MAHWPFSLDLLPVAGITNPTATIEAIRGRLVNTLTILDGVVRMPSGLPGDLKQAIYNVRFHVVTGLGLIDSKLQLGSAIIEPASIVDGLWASIDNHIAELRRTVPLWHSWLNSERRQGFGNDVPAPIRSRFLQAAAQPVNTGDYVGAGLATYGLYGLSRVPSMFHGMMDNPSVFHGDEVVPGMNAGLTDPLAPYPVTSAAVKDDSRWMFLGFGALIGAGLIMFSKKR